MRYGISIPNFGDWADPRTMVDLARDAEAAGWDGFFLWDHVRFSATPLPVQDPWSLLAAIAVTTERLVIGPMVTPLQRRRPWIVARQAVTVDHLSNGRLILGVGIGEPVDVELTAFGEADDLKTRAAMLDEALTVLDGLWSGEEFAHEGTYYHLAPMTFLRARSSVRGSRSSSPATGRTAGRSDARRAGTGCTRSTRIPSRTGRARPGRSSPSCARCVPIPTPRSSSSTAATPPTTAPTRTTRHCPPTSARHGGSRASIRGTSAGTARPRAGRRSSRCAIGSGSARPVPDSVERAQCPASSASSGPSSATPESRPGMPRRPTSPPGPQPPTGDDGRAWERMLDALDDLSPRVEAVDRGVALVDVTGLGPTWGSEQRIAARAVALVRGVAPHHVRCGIGDNRWLAALAARLARPTRPDAPAAFRVLERDELADLPLTLLPVDAAIRQRFAIFGLTRMAQLADLPRSAVGAQFGAPGERLQALARGHDPRPLVPRRRPERVEASATFEPALDGIGSVGLTLRRLAADLCERLAERGLAPGRAVLTPAARGCAGAPDRAAVPAAGARAGLDRAPAARPPRGGRRLAHAASRLDGRGAEPRVASVALALDRLTDPASRQLPAFEVQAGRWEELRWSLERIRHRFGEGRLWRAEAVRPTAALPEHRSRLVDIGG